MNKKEIEAFAKQAAKGIKSEQDLADFRKILTTRHLFRPTTNANRAFILDTNSNSLENAKWSTSSKIHYKQ